MENYRVKKYAICYFDILGYKQMLDQVGDNVFIHYIVAVIDTVKQILNDGGIISFEYHIFSDNVIIFVPVYKDECGNITTIAEFIRCMSLLQRNLMGQYSIFIRGCITLGDLFYGGDFIYGSGLIKAYNLEDRIAIYPRIILDEECVDMCCSENQSFWQFVCKSYVKKDIDGHYYLSYLDDLKTNYMSISENYRSGKQITPIDTRKYSELPSPFRTIDFSKDNIVQRVFEKYASTRNIIGLNYLLLHKIIVEQNLAVVTDESVRMKYLWCKKYHNEVCKDNIVPELVIE